MCADSGHREIASTRHKMRRPRHLRFDRERAGVSGQTVMRVMRLQCAGASLEFAEPDGKHSCGGGETGKDVRQALKSGLSRHRHCLLNKDGLEGTVVGTGT